MRQSPAKAIGAIIATACLALPGLFGGAKEAMAQSAKPSLQIEIVYLTKLEEERLPLSLVEPILTDNGAAGARKALQDNSTTGRLLKHEYSLIDAIVPIDGDLVATFKQQLAEGRRLFVADLHADQLLALADLPEAADALIFNVRATDDRLRNNDCRRNVMHIIPSRAMKTDALSQYFAWKKWRNLFLVHGTRDVDLAYVAALRRAASRFGLKIVEERRFEGDAPSARTETGHAQVQKQMPVFTQDAEEHHVLLVADEADVFGEYLPYRTWDPRPVAGTQGLIATAWHRSHEQWAGTQMQRRFEKFTGRAMTERDYTAWAAVRSIGDAVTRTGSVDAGVIRDFLLSDKFKLGAFKGQGLTFRRWNQQMRQPILLAAPRSLVSVSPQPGFLHERTRLDTMGYDEPESTCDLSG